MQTRILRKGRRSIVSAPVAARPEGRVEWTEARLGRMYGVDSEGRVFVAFDDRPARDTYVSTDDVPPPRRARESAVAHA